MVSVVLGCGPGRQEGGSQTGWFLPGAIDDRCPSCPEDWAADPPVVTFCPFHHFEYVDASGFYDLRHKNLILDFLLIESQLVA